MVKLDLPKELRGRNYQLSILLCQKKMRLGKLADGAAILSRAQAGGHHLPLTFFQG